jgi:hypothetical protein
MPELQKNLPPVQAFTLDDIYIQEARIRAAALGHDAELAKRRGIDLTAHRLESPLSDQAKYQLGGAGLRLAVSSRAEFTIPADEN